MNKDEAIFHCSETSFLFMRKPACLYKAGSFLSTSKLNIKRANYIALLPYYDLIFLEAIKSDSSTILTILYSFANSYAS